MLHDLSAVMGTEAIKHQMKTALFEDLLAMVNKIRQSPKLNQATIAESGFASILKRHLDMNAYLQVSDIRFDASCKPAHLDANHEYHKRLPRDVQAAAKNELSEEAAYWTATKKYIAGSVDTATGRLGGDFTSMPVRFMLWGGFLRNNSLFTPEETAGIILHEVGHGVTFFRALNATVTVNSIVATAADELLSTKDVKFKYKLINNLEDSYGIKYSDEGKETLVDTDSKSAASTIILSHTIKSTRSELDAGILDMRQCETAADQFAARHGGGVAVASGLAKLYKATGHSSTKSRIRILFGAILSMLAGAFIFMMGQATAWFMIPFNMLRSFIGFIYSNPNAAMYDDPETRLKKIRLELIARSKGKLNKQQRKDLDSEIECIDALISELDDKQSLHQLVWNNLTPGGRKYKNRAAYQETVEQLFNNDLYAAANLFAAKA